MVRGGSAHRGAFTHDQKMNGTDPNTNGVSCGGDMGKGGHQGEQNILERTARLKPPPLAGPGSTSEEKANSHKKEERGGLITKRGDFLQWRERSA